MKTEHKEKSKKSKSGKMETHTRVRACAQMTKRTYAKRANVLWMLADEFAQLNPQEMV